MANGVMRNGDLNLHGGDVGCVCDVQSLVSQSDYVVARPSTEVDSVEDPRSQSSILC